jgi:putative restriction endonuclease
MTTLSRNELLERLIEAINASGWNILYDTGISDRPFKLRLYKGDEFQRLRVYIWNISHGGGYMRPANEYRIQVHVPRFEPEEGWKVLILGWWEDGKVFAGFDFRKHQGELGRSASLQIKRESLENAVINGFAPSDKGNREIAIAFRPDLFVEYANHSTEFHSFGESNSDIQILETISANQSQLQNDEIIQQVTRPRQTAFQTIRRSLRDHSFKNRILTAYNYRCAFCDIQLNLIEAAHIIPVSYETSTDETRNGIALCTLHHKAYDNSLVTFNERYQIVSSEQKIENLRQINRDGGIQRFVNDLKPVIGVPPENRDRPHVNYVARANRIRGW